MNNTPKSNCSTVFRIFFALCVVFATVSCEKENIGRYHLESLWIAGNINANYRELLFFYDNFCFVISKNQNHGYIFPTVKIPFRRMDNDILLSTEKTAGTLCRIEENGKILKRIYGKGKGHIIYFSITEAEADLLLQKFTIKDIINTYFHPTSL